MSDSDYLQADEQLHDWQVEREQRLQEELDLKRAALIDELRTRGEAIDAIVDAAREKEEPAHGIEYTTHDGESVIVVEPSKSEPLPSDSATKAKRVLWRIQDWASWIVGLIVASAVLTWLLNGGAATVAALFGK